MIHLGFMILRTSHDPTQNLHLASQLCCHSILALVSLLIIRVEGNLSHRTRSILQLTVVVSVMDI